MKFLHVDFENEASILHSTDQIAEKISKDILFQVNGSHYRIVDFEFYCYSEKFSDPHTHKNDLQKETGKIYLHGSGLDITFGDGENYGGMLIRGVVKLYDGAGAEEGHMKKQYDGPHKVATELFSGLHSVLDPNQKNEIRLTDIEGRNFDALLTLPVKVLKTSRVGLTKKEKDPEDTYMNLPLRYIVVLKKFPKFKQSIKGLENILEEYLGSGRITSAEANELLGYNRKF
jgi:hypothetical protein